MPAADEVIEITALKLPVESETTLEGVVSNWTLSYVMVMAELAAKPVPLTVTDVPAGPELGLRVIEGVCEGVVTVKVALAVAAPPVAVTVFAPAVADDGTLKEVVKDPVEVEVTLATFVPLNVTCTVALAG